MAKFLIIGFGNTIRGDDGLGPLAAQRVESLVHDENVKVLIRHQMGIELAGELSRADVVIFMDAHVGGTPGTLREEEVVPEDSAPGSFSHHLRPGVLLACADALYQRRPRAFAYSIAAASFDHGEGLSPAVEATLPLLIEKVIAKIEEFKKS